MKLLKSNSLYRLMLKCIIVDDEPIARKGLVMLLSQYQQIEVSGAFPSADSAMAFLADNHVDLVFLDIQMPGISGLDMAKSVSADTMVIFVTAYMEYAIDSYELDAIDYLLKPIKKERLSKAIDKALRYSTLLSGKELMTEEPKVSKEYLTLRADRGYARVPIKDIVQIQGLKDYVIINLKDRKIVAKMTIKKLLDILPVEEFLRVNKSCVVNTSKITYFNNNDVIIDDEEIAIGPSYREKVLNALLHSK